VSDNPPVCTECGAIVPAFQATQSRLESVEGKLEKAWGALDAKEREAEELSESVLRTQRQLSTARGQIKQLREQQSTADDELSKQAMEICEYWRDLIAPKARELKGPRFDNTLKRLKAGYPVDELKLAVYGYYCRPYVVDSKRKHTGRPDQKHNDLELIMRTPQHVDKGIAIARHDAKLDVEHVHRGGTLPLSRLCDCGHPAVDHLRPDLAFALGLVDEKAAHPGGIREPCAHKDCPCYTFDTLHQFINEKIEQARTPAAKPKSPPVRKAA
jgi:hypothetical protein